MSQRYRHFFDFYKDPVFFLDIRSHRIIEANQSAETLLGLKLVELRTKTFSDILDQPSASLFKRTMISQSLPVTLPLRFHTVEDRMFHLMITSLEDDRSPILSVMVMGDEEKSSDSESNPTVRALTAGGVVVWEYDQLENKISFQGTLHDSPLTRELDLPLTNFYDTIIPEDFQRITLTLQGFFAGDMQELKAEFRLGTAMENSRYSIMRGKNEGGVIHGTLIDVHDCRTNIKKYEIAERRYEGIVEHSMDMIFSLDADGRFIFANRALINETGFYWEELKDRTFLELVDEPHRQTAMETFRSITANEGDPNETYELIIRKKDGSPLWAEVRVSRSVAANSVDGIEGVARNITKRKIAEDLLARAGANVNALLDNSLQASVLLSLEEKVQAFNAIAATMVKLVFRKEIHSGTPVRDILPLSEYEDFHNSFLSAARGETVTVDKELTISSHFRPWLEYRFVPVLMDKIVIGVSVSINDITKRKETERSLWESKERYKAISNMISDFAFAARFEDDNSVSLEWITESFSRISGYPMHELLQPGGLDRLFHHNDFSIISNARRTVASGHPIVAEYRIITKYGETRWLRQHTRPIVEEDSPIIRRYIGAGQDITDQKITEAALSKNLENFYTLINSLSEGVLYIDSTLHVFRTNPAAEKILGLNESELLGRTLADALLQFTDANGHPLSPDCNPVLKSIADVQPLHNVKLGYYDPESKFHCLSVNINPFSHPVNKQLQEVVLTLTDVTPLYEGEKMMNSLREDLSRVSRVARQARVALVLCDTTQRILWVNDAFTTLTGWNNEDAQGRFLPDLLIDGEEDKPEVLKMLREIEEKHLLHSLFKVKSQNGSELWLDYVVDPLYDDESTHLGYITVLVDASEKETLKQELQSLRALSSGSESVRASFLAMMSHELRTPLNTILANASLLRDELGENGVKSLAEAIFADGYKLLATVNSLFEIQDITQENYAPDLTEMNLNSVLKEVFRQFKPSAEQKKLYCKIIEKDEGLIVPGDPRYLKAVISKVISNAVKFTETGGITVIVEIVETGDDKLARVTVKDTGIGIPDPLQASVFDAFSQVSKGYERAYTGTGLGLTLAKHFAEALGATITLNSKVDQGTAVMIDFPLLRHTPPMDVAPSLFEELENNEQELPELLIVDDDQYSREVAVICIERDYRYELCATGAEAVEKIKQKQYAGVLLDINLGKGLSGLQVLEEIVLRPEYKQVPVIAVTAFALRSDREYFLSRGCTHYIAKPYGRRQLLDLISSAIDEMKVSAEKD